MSTPATPVPAAPGPATLDSPDISQSDYRALREGKTVVRAAPLSASETAADSEPVEHQEDSPSTAEGGGEPSPAAKRDGLNKRFSELTGQIKRLEGELARSRPAPSPEPPRPQAPQQTPAQAAADDAEPQADKYTDFLAYQKDLTKWMIRQDRKADAAQAEQAKRAQTIQQKRDNWTNSVKTAQTKYTDFVTVAQDPDLPVTPPMADAITDSELGTEILYHLGKHPEEAARIAKLHPLSAIREIGKIEAALTPAAKPDDTDEENEPPAQPVSRAPRPIRPVAAAAAAGGSLNLMSDRAMQSMTQSEYRAYREAGKIR